MRRNLANNRGDITGGELERSKTDMYKHENWELMWVFARSSMEGSYITVVQLRVTELATLARRTAVSLYRLNVAPAIANNSNIMND